MASRLQQQTRQLELDLQHATPEIAGIYESDLQDIESSLATLSLLAEDVDGTTQQKIAQMVAPVRMMAQTLKGRIESLKQHQVITTVPSQIQPLGNKPPQFFYAKNNQMDEAFIPLYKDGDPANRRSACTMIAGEFVQQTLAGKGPEALDQIMQSGQQKMALSKANAGTIFDEVTGQFPDVELLPLTDRMLDINPVGEIAFDRQLGKNGFKAAIELLQELKRENNLPSLGAVLTNPPESYALVITDNGILFFDSHGDMPQTNGSLVKGRAYVASFSNAAEASAFLARRLPVMEFLPDRSNESANVDKIIQDPQLDLFQPLAIIRMFPLKAKKPVQITQPTPILATTPPTLDNRNILPLTLPKDTAPLLPKATVILPIPSVDRVDPLLGEVYLLLEVIDNLKKGDEGFYNSFGPIAELAKKTCVLAMTDKKNPISIGDRLFFHTYFIHKNESPEKIDHRNHQYGTHAFQTGLATPEERVRCAQRTLVEMALTGMSDAIAQKDVKSLRQYLAVLENLNLDEKDLPKGVKNIAHALFGALYQDYKKAWEVEKSMTHPHDGAFKGDFGRHAFNDTGSVNIPARFKTAVIEQFTEQLRQAWKLG